MSLNILNIDSGDVTPSFMDGVAPRDGDPLYERMSRGLVGAWMPMLGFAGGEIIQDFSTQENHIKFGDGITNVADSSDLINITKDDWFSDRHGLSIALAGTEYGYVFPSRFPIRSFPFSLAVLVKPTTDSLGVIFDIGITTESDTNYCLAYQSTGNVAAMRTRESVGGGVLQTDNGTIDILGRWVSIVGVWHAPAVRRLYVDGIPDGSFNAARGFTASPDDLRFGIGRFVDNTPSTQFFGLVSAAMAFNIGLNADDAKILARDPVAPLRLAATPLDLSFPSAAPSGLSIPIAMRHYLQIMGAG